MFDSAGIEELAWAAGLFDGEGSTTSSGTYEYPHTTVPQAGSVDAVPDVLARFGRIVGVGSISGPYMIKPGWQPMWRYVATNVQAIQVLDRMWPYLGAVKRDQATLVLERYRQHPTTRRDMAVATGRPLTQMCRKGHDLATAYIYKGRRHCRECRRADDRRRRSRRRQP